LIEPRRRGSLSFPLDLVIGCINQLIIIGKSSIFSMGILPSPLQFLVTWQKVNYCRFFIIIIIIYFFSFYWCLHCMKILRMLEQQRQYSGTYSQNLSSLEWFILHQWLQECVASSNSKANSTPYFLKTSFRVLIRI
jgi:hypothetical protein